VDHAPSAQTQQPAIDVNTLLRTPLRQLSAATVGPVVRRIVEDRTRPETVDVAAFNSSI
jgi:FXSXX-COOH protein